MRQDPPASDGHGALCPVRRLMLEKRDLKKDLLALGLLALAVFLVAALMSYDPADPPSKLVYPERHRSPQCLRPLWGLRQPLLFTALGLGSYYLVLSLAALDAMLLARRPLNQPIIRLCGWLISLAGLTTIVAMAAPHFAWPVIGAGGYLGAAGRGLLELNFATVGAYILTTSLLLGGLLLSTDYLLLHVVAFIGRSSSASRRRALGRACFRSALPPPSVCGGSPTSMAMSLPKMRPTARLSFSRSASRDDRLKRPSRTHRPMLRP